jgi:F-type H+-transporting ATPase subunit delta
MSDTTIARRYARALYEEAARENKLAATGEDVGLLRESLDGSRELVRFFQSPLASREKKKAAARALFGDRVGALMMRFLEVLIEKHREDALPSILRAYGELQDREEGVIEAHARVPGPLDPSAEANLIAALERITGKSVRLVTEKDPGLVGGVVIRIGDTVYDGSVAQQLRSLRRRMESGTFAVDGAGPTPH